MAFSHGAGGVKVYMNGRNLSGYLSETSTAGEIDKNDVTTFVSTAREYVMGLEDATFSGGGVYDAAGTVGVDAVFNAAMQLPATFEHFPAGDAIGSRGWAGGTAAVTKYEVKTPVDDVNRISFDVQSSTGFEQIISHEPLTASLTGGGTASSTVDNAASSPGGGFGYLQVSALTAGTAVVKIQHSTDNSSFSDLIVFPNVTATTAGTALRAQVTGTVNRYTRATWAVTGGTATLHAAFGRLP